MEVWKFTRAIQRLDMSRNHFGSARLHVLLFLGGKLVANGEAEYQETDVVIEAWRFPI
jgi:hypothetical protein